MIGKVASALAIGGTAIVAIWAMQNFRRPYVVERIALELGCPSHQDDPECWLYSRFGIIYAPEQQLSPVSQVPDCKDPQWHFVGRNSDGTAQCCGLGYHWDGPDTGKCTQDAPPPPMQCKVGQHVVGMNPDGTAKCCNDGYHYVGGTLCCPDGFHADPSQKGMCAKDWANQ
jgi:hypothetical protein